ncbi:ABC transporter substrate-binding protein [Halalkalibacillus sediminis]|uniref:ABC transporter substrate-binding protein n=1 Tax=Halalkalibacillus sediminis TaxID=2018042 RepID=A0A2I0QRX8_9BACI|nr:ABC transporter substrate-binding protein [Halalkalibacillus sediminis]PKR77092.1 ABC transporter substrate-binding protein [Halalkalibacillus sediminis]
MKKWLLSILFIVAAMLVISACGAESEDEAVGDLEEESSEESSGAEEESDEEVEGSSESSGEAAIEDGVLKMGTSADFPPFESIDESGEFVGFDIDLAHKIADELGYELEISDMSFDGLIGALQSERVHMVLAGMSATEERKENVDFSPAYHHSGEYFVTQDGSDITSIEDIEGKVIGVQQGTIQEEGAKTLQEDYDFEIKGMTESSTLIQELITGRVDIAYMDTTVAEGHIEEQGLAGFEDPTTASPGMAVAFPKDSELTDEVSEVIEKFLEDGTIEELEEKWELGEDE